MLDDTDKQILDLLSQNSRITMRELSKKIHLTAPATAARVAKLEDNGVIEEYTIKANQEKMGCFVHAFVQIYTENANHQPYLDYLKKHAPYVINNYKISGESCYLLESQFPSNELLDEFLTGLSDFVGYKLSIVINK